MKAGARKIAIAGSAVLLVILAAAWLLRGPLSTTGATAPVARATYAGSASCAACHAAQQAAWQGSQHAAAMQDATDKTVLGNFADTTFKNASVTSRFIRRDDKFVVNTDGPDGKPADFEVKYTFGLYPLQQYLVPFPGGRLQALGIAWDARAAADGGQRWFHLYPDTPPAAGDPLHWTGIDQNWNYQCADCHSTDLRKNFDAATGNFATAWSEISVGCEACHGPASNHIAWANKQDGWRAMDATRGLAVRLDERAGVKWTANPAGTAARSKPRTTSREIDSCAHCHARRAQFADDIDAGGNWLDAFRPALLDARLYYPDGQQREEVYTWGSFLQSRMHAAGVTCSDCHDPHTQKLRAPGNAVCTQCHAAAVFDASTHHHHAAGSKGAECAACHMPTTTYMVVDPRHDHSLRIPRPDRSVTMGVPNACNPCHADRAPQWAADAIAGWYPDRKPGYQTFAEAFDLGDRAAPGAQRALLGVAADSAQPGLVRASAVARLGHFFTPSVLPALTAAVTDGDPLVRLAAANALANADAATRAEHLPRLLTDPVRVVRMDAARALAGEAETRLLADERPRFETALAEWIAAQDFQADRPEAQMNLGTLALERGDPDAAVAAFRRALSLDPQLVEAYVNLADVSRARGDDAQAESILRQALSTHPRAGILHHALGLTLIREKRMQDGVKALGQAAALAPEDAHLVYAYGVALHDTGKPRKAVAELEKALARHPYDREILAALVPYQAEAGNAQRSQELAGLLRELEPDMGN